MDFDDIYAHKAQMYDELVRYEDARGNLWKTLDQLYPWKNATVIELGAGTGRLTLELAQRCDKVCAFDKSAVMLDIAKSHLAARNLEKKVELAEAEHRGVPLKSHSADAIVEGWAFGHYIDFDPHHWESCIAAALLECRRLVRPGGAIFLIETLGTGTSVPKPPTEVHGRLYQILENIHGFKRYEVRTDYSFPTSEVASRVVGGFFGQEMVRKLHGTEGTSLDEVTGIWLLRTG